jgi:structural maintenance of chromosomes protein 5
LRSQHESLVEAEIRLIEAKSEFNALKADNREILQRLQAKEAEKDQLHQRQQQLREQHARMARITQKDIESLSDEEKAMISEYKNLGSLEALEQEVQAVDARLEMMAEGNPGAIRAYENREEEIKKTERLLDTHAANLSETKEEIAEIRQEWEPQLDALIRQISDAFAYNFQQIGCAGEVEVYKDEEDFDNWSIQISVRFR